MKSSFNGYYAPDAAQIKSLWERGTFILDTNVLLHLYRVPQSTRDQVLSALQALKGRLWIPRHVGLEFQRRRLGAIHSAHQKTAAVLKEIDKALVGYFTAVEKADLKERGVTEADASLTAIRDEASKVRDTVEATLAGQLSPTDHDSIRDSLDELFQQVGAPPTQEQVTAWDALAKDRFALKRGPGFEDGTKAEGDEPQYYAQGVTYQSQYGDLYIWMQILDHVKENNIEDVVFVTRDAKEDWWRLAPGEGKNRARLAPLEMLVEEMNQAGAKNFWMYQLDTFLIDAEKQLKVDVSDLTLKDASQVEQVETAPEQLLPRMIRPISAADCARALELLSCSIVRQGPSVASGFYKMVSGTCVGVIVFPARLLMGDKTDRLKEAVELLNLLEGAERYEFYLLCRTPETANAPHRMRALRNLVRDAVPDGTPYQMQVLTFTDSSRSELSLVKTISTTT